MKAQYDLLALCFLLGDQTLECYPLLVLQYLKVTDINADELFSFFLECFL
jgi:hypothetical protein